MTSSSKQRLRPWLMGKLDSQTIPGLEWLPNEGGDIDRKKFRIAWKHGGKQDWSPEMGQVFKGWAEQTGKYREGVDKEDYAKWKTNLRCAMNKSSDMQEIKEESNLNGESPFKVYRFLERKDKEQGSRVHVTNYGRGDIYQNRTCNKAEYQGLPCQVADYSSGGSSMSTNPSGTKWSFPSVKQEADACAPGVERSLPSDLMDVKSSSLKEWDGALSSLDRDKLVKEESLGSFNMDFECASSGPSDSSGQMPPLMPLYVVDTAGQNADNDNLDLNDPSSNLTDQLLNIAQAAPNVGPNASEAVFVTLANTSAINVPSPASSTLSPNSSQSTYVYSPPDSNATPVQSPAYQYSTSSQSSPAQPYSPEQFGPEQYTAFQPHTTISQDSPQLFQNADVIGPTDMSLGLEPFGIVDALQTNIEVPTNAESSSMHQQGNPLLASMLNRGPVDIGHDCPYATESSSMMVTIMYNNVVQYEGHITKPEGCCIAFEPFPDEIKQCLDQAGYREIASVLFDNPPGREIIALPPWPQSKNQKLDREVENLLKNSSRGIVITCSGGGIYVKRLCKTSIYFASDFNECEKIARFEHNLQSPPVFDYNNQFWPALQAFERSHVDTMTDQEEAKYPHSELYLFIGQKGTPDTAHMRYIVVKVVSCRAQKALKSVESRLFESLEPEISKSTQLDELDQFFKKTLGEVGGIVPSNGTEIN